LKGVDGAGRRLTEDEVMYSVKLYVNSKDQNFDYDILA